MSTIRSKEIWCSSFIVLAVLVLTPELYSQVKWERLITGRPCERIVITKDNIVVTAPGYNTIMSADAGHSWKTIVSYSDTVRYYGQDPHGVHYLQIKSKGLYKSTNSGIAWQKILDAAYSYPYAFGRELLRILPTGNLLYSTLLPYSTFGVLYSSDKGITWSQRNEGLARPDLTHIVGVLNDSSIIAQDVSNRVYVSRDEGLHWTLVDMTFPYPNTNPSDVEFMQQSNDGGLLAVGRVGYYSTDYGMTWSRTAIQGVFYYVTNLNRSFYDSLGNAYVCDTWRQPGRMQKFNMRQNQWSDIRYNIDEYALSRLNDMATDNNGTVYASADNGLYALRPSVNTTDSPYRAGDVEILSIYPTTVSGYMYISVRAADTKMIDIHLYDLHGGLVLSDTRTVYAYQINTIRLDMPYAGSGVFFVDLAENGGIVVRKVVVLQRF